MDFDKNKEITIEKLRKDDKSKQGYVDKDILPLLELINRKKNYYTTSSCSGRMMLFSAGKRKCDALWVYVSHGSCSYKDLEPHLKELPEKTLWLRQEPMIMHICCRTMKDAETLLDKVRALGLKRSGIISKSKRIMVEISALHKMDVPIAEKGKLKCDEEYLRFVVEKANEKLKANRENIKKLEKELKGLE